MTTYLIGGYLDNLSLGQGDVLGGRVGTPPPTHVLGLTDGTASSPAAIGVSVRFSRTDATTRAEVDAMGPEGTDGPDGATALAASVKGVAGNEVQIVGGFFSAWQTSAYVGTGNDACAVYGFARTSGSATGRAIAGYFEADRENTASRGQQTLELRVKNTTGVVDTYVSNGPSRSMGEWTNAAGGQIGAAYVIGHNFSQQFDVGYAANAGAILSSTFRDDSSSKVSLDVRGEHSEAAILIHEKAGPITFNNPSGNFKLQQAFNVGDYMTGTAAGDGVILTGGKTVHIGAGSGRAMLRVSGTNLAIGTSAADSFGSGTGMVFVAKASTAPTVTPTGGFLLYADPTTGAVMVRTPTETKELAK